MPVQGSALVPRCDPWLMAVIPSGIGFMQLGGDFLFQLLLAALQGSNGDKGRPPISSAVRSALT